MTISADVKTVNNFISTHTLTWSVTRTCKVNTCHIFISTHTLTWSVTVEKSMTVFPTLDFNSHAHVERDILKDDMETAVRISTHTLTWSVT